MTETQLRKWTTGFKYVISFAVGMAACYLLQGYQEVELQVTTPTGESVTLRAKDGKMDYEAVLNELMDGFMRGSVVAWMAGKNFYHFEDERLARVLNEELCDPIPEENLIDRESRVKLSQACASHPIAEKLRDLAFYNKVPFHHVGFDVKIGVPAEEEDQPRTGFASVCRSKGLRSRKIRLTNPEGNELLDIQASGVYVCTGFDNYPDVQLNTEDARTLFGDTPLSKYEQAIAVPMD